MVVKSDSRRSATDLVVGDHRNVATGSRSAPAPRRWVWEWTKSILIAFALFLVIRTFLAEAFRIPTGSMEDTLLVGDFLLVNKAVFGHRIPFTDRHVPGWDRPRREDIIVFTPPHDPGKNYVKRLIALAGDTVEMRRKVVYINGDPIVEPYARHTDPEDTYSPQMHWQCAYLADANPASCQPMRDNWGPLVVPADSLLVLGDNRDDSEDSRYWGFVGRDAIKGRPLFIYYSFESGSRRPIPWLTNIRWGRIGDAIQ